MKNFSNYTDYDKKDNLHFESKAVHGALRNRTVDRSSQPCRFSRQWLTDIRHLESPQALRTAVWRTLTRQELERTMDNPWGWNQGICIFQRTGCKYGCIFSAESGRPLFFFLMIFMAEPSVLSVTCSENTALSTLTWRWMILTQWRQQSSQIQKCFFVETPTNPMMKVADIQALSEIAKSVGHLWCW